MPIKPEAMKNMVAELGTRLIQPVETPDIGLKRATEINTLRLKAEKDSLQIINASPTLGVLGKPRSSMQARAVEEHTKRPKSNFKTAPTEGPRLTNMSKEIPRPKTAALLPLLPNAPKRTPFPELPKELPVSTLKNVINSTKLAGVVDRAVKEVADLQWGYRFQKNPWAEANDSVRSRNFINYEGPQASFKSAEAKTLASAVKSGLKDETEGYEYWMSTSKLLNAAGMKSEARQAVQKAGQENQHHALLERIKAKMEKKSSLEKTAIIREEGGKYIIYSHSGKRLSKPYTSLDEAKHRLSQIEYFKHQKTGEAIQSVTLRGVKFRKLNPTKEVGHEPTPRGVSPELSLEISDSPDILAKGGSLRLNTYLRNRKTLLS